MKFQIRPGLAAVSIATAGKAAIARNATMVFAALLAGLALLSTQTHAACEIPQATPAEHVARSVAIFEAEVVRVRPATRPSGVLRSVATFRVLEAYKGTRPGAAFTVALDGSDCGLQVVAGDKLTVFVGSWLGTNVYNKVSVGRFSDPMLKDDYDKLLAAEKSKFR